MEFVLTRRQVARGARPDAEVANKLYLIKNVSTLHATYQVRLLLYRAISEDKKLIVDVPKHCQLSGPLASLVKENRHHLQIVKS